VRCPGQTGKRKPKKMPIEDLNVKINLKKTQDLNVRTDKRRT
jgi:hypothetical protein